MALIHHHDTINLEKMNDRVHRRPDNRRNHLTRDLSSRSFFHFFPQFLAVVFFTTIRSAAPFPQTAGQISVVLLILPGRPFRDLIYGLCFRRNSSHKPLFTNQNQTSGRFTGFHMAYAVFFFHRWPIGFDWV